eukprot:1103942-Rhodomonas_salina.3
MAGQHWRRMPRHVRSRYPARTALWRSYAVSGTPYGMPGSDIGSGGTRLKCSGSSSVESCRPLHLPTPSLRYLPTPSIRSARYLARPR